MCRTIISFCYSICLLEQSLTGFLFKMIHGYINNSRIREVPRQSASIPTSHLLASALAPTLDHGHVVEPGSTTPLTWVTFFLCVCWQTYFRSIDESSKEFGASNCVEPLQRYMDIHGCTSLWGYSWSLGVQYHKVH